MAFSSMALDNARGTELKSKPSAVAAFYHKLKDVEHFLCSVPSDQVAINLKVITSLLYSHGLKRKFLIKNKTVS